MKRFCVAVALITFSALTAVKAAPTFPGPAVDTGQAALVPVAMTPDQVLQQGIGRLRAFLASPAVPPAAVRAFLDQEIAPSFDFAYMARWAAGRYYQRMNDSQRATFTARLSDLFLDALARNLGTRLRPLPPIDIYTARAGRWPNEVSVTTQIRPAAALPIRLEFRFYRSPRGWRVFDVSANGASAVTFYRRYFSEQVRRFGLQAFSR